VRGGDRVPGAPRAARHLVEHTERLVEEQDVRPATAEAEVAAGEEDDVAAVPADRRERAVAGGLRELRQDAGRAVEQEDLRAGRAGGEEVSGRLEDHEPRVLADAGMRAVPEAVGEADGLRTPRACPGLRGTSDRWITRDRVEPDLLEAVRGAVDRRVRVEDEIAAAGEQVGVCVECRVFAHPGTLRQRDLLDVAARRTGLEVAGL